MTSSTRTSGTSVVFILSVDRHNQAHCRRFMCFVRINRDSRYCALSGRPDNGHARRRFFDLYEAMKSPLAKEVLDRIAVLYQIEDKIRGCAPDQHRDIRRIHAVPVLNALHARMMEKVPQVGRNTDLGAAFAYSLNRWESLCRYTQDGRLEIDNNSAERSVRGIGVGRKNFLFFGSDNGGERAAIIYSLIESCKLNHIDPQRYLHYVLERIADHPINQIADLLPWKVKDKLNQPAQVAESLAA